MNRLFTGVLLSVVFVVGACLSVAHSQIRETGSPAMVQQCKKNFDAMDTNGDGAVSKDEFFSVEHKGRNPEEAFKARDTNGDNVLSKDEFCSGKGAGRGRK